MAAAEDPRATAARARLTSVLKEKWRLDELLGVGGMAAVFSATHRNGKRVAIKMLHREYALDAEVTARFLREAYIVNKVEHKGVVGVLDNDVSSDGCAFLVMDLLEGESLEQRRQRKGGKLPPAEVLSVADQVLDVLVVAHRGGMVHRDLKPENLFLCRDGNVKLLDFGIARLRELSAKIGATQASGTTMGTPAFMPPEQARGHWDNVDARSDLWALGATMFTLLTGLIVHEASNVTDLLIAAMTKPPPALALRFPSPSPALAEVVDRALQFESSERWPDARLMQDAVRDAYREVSGRVATAPMPLEITGRVSSDVVKAVRAEVARKLAASPQAQAMGRLAAEVAPKLGMPFGAGGASAPPSARRPDLSAPRAPFPPVSQGVPTPPMAPKPFAPVASPQAASPVPVAPPRVAETPAPQPPMSAPQLAQAAPEPPPMAAADGFPKTQHAIAPPVVPASIPTPQIEVRMAATLPGGAVAALPLKSRGTVPIPANMVPQSPSAPRPGAPPIGATQPMPSQAAPTPRMMLPAQPQSPLRDPAPPPPQPMPQLPRPRPIVAEPPSLGGAIPDLPFSPPPSPMRSQTRAILLLIAGAAIAGTLGLIGIALLSHARAPAPDVVDAGAR